MKRNWLAPLCRRRTHVLYVLGDVPLYYLCRPTFDVPSFAATAWRTPNPIPQTFVICVVNIIIVILLRRPVIIRACVRQKSILPKAVRRLVYCSGFDFFTNAFTVTYTGWSFILFYFFIIIIVIDQRLSAEVSSKFYFRVFRSLLSRLRVVYGQFSKLHPYRSYREHMCKLSIFKRNPNYLPLRHLMRDEYK